MMMSTKRGRTRAVTVVVAVVVMVCVWSLSVADEGERDGSGEMMAGSTKTIERRLEDLERIIGSSKTPVSGRIDVLEDGLRDLTKALGGTGWSSVKSNIREAKKTLDELARHRKQQDEDLRRLRQVGKSLERVGDDLGKVRRAMDEMERRLRRLESRS